MGAWGEAGGVLCAAREQIESVGQDGKGSAEGTDGSCRASGKVEDQTGSQGATEAAAQYRHRGLAAAFGAH